VGTIARLLRRAWAGPATALGLLLAPWFGRRSVRDGILLCEGAGWPRRLGFRHRAMTLGHVVLCTDDIDEATWAHELVHVSQYERLGPAFFVAYGVASLAALIRGGHVYADNRYERDARSGAGREPPEPR
jgi:hypothetical protein